jgi:hypothetical protein
LNKSKPQENGVNENNNVVSETGIELSNEQFVLKQENYKNNGWSLVGEPKQDKDNPRVYMEWKRDTWIKDLSETWTIPVSGIVPIKNDDKIIRYELPENKNQNVYFNRVVKPNYISWTKNILVGSGIAALAYSFWPSSK